MADPVIINPTLTLAGQAAAFNASNDGLELKITHVSFGTAHYDPVGNEVALRTPVGNRVAVAGASRPTPYQIRMVSVWSEDVGQVGVGEIAFWADDVLVFVWSKSDGSVASYKTNGVSYVLFNDLAFGQVPANSVSFVIDPNESVALAALLAHEGDPNAHPQYILKAKYPDYQGYLWGEVTGTANAIALTLPAEVVLTSYIKGNRFTFKATSSNTGNTTININGVGPVQVLKTGGVALTSGSIVEGGVYDVYYDGAKFQLTAGAGFASAEATEAEVTALAATDSTSWISLRRLIKALSNFAKLGGAVFTGEVSGLTPDQFDNDKSFATTEFVQRANGNFSKQTNLAGPNSITAAMAGSRIVATGNGTLTLPPLKSSPAGSKFYIYNAGGNALTIATQGAERMTAFTTADLATVTVPSGYTAVITCGESFYVLEEGTASLKYSPAMTEANFSTPPQFDSTKKLATTEFVQRALGNKAGVTSVSAATVLSATAFGKVILANPAAPFTLTLPPSASGPSGGVITVSNIGPTSLTVVPSAGDSLSNIASSPQASLSIPPGSSCDFELQGNTYYLSGTAALKLTTEFAAQLGTQNANYQRLPSGQVEQWGIYVAAPSGSNTVIPLPITFAVAPTDIELTFANFTNDEVVGSSPQLQARNSTTNSITVRNLHGSAASFFWNVKGRV